MAHIFISYSHKDTAYVEKLEKKLKDQGFDVWVDHRIDYGSRWTKEIEYAIDTCAAYIVVMSDEAKESQWVQREVIHAEKRRKPFFPLLLKGEAWFSLGNIQFVDVTGGKLPPAKFYQRLATVVPRGGQLASAIPPSAVSSSKKSNTLPFWIGGVTILACTLLGFGYLISKIISPLAQPIDQDLVDVTSVPSTLPADPSQDPNIPPADAQLGDTWTRPTDGMVMSYIPAGEFQMGSEDGQDEKPVHRVYLDAFWIDQTEVTNAMYVACVSNGRCDAPSDTKYMDNPLYVNHPVAYMSWDDAKNYCEKVGGRLPTEAEWEKAARGGLVGKRYPWGDEAPLCERGVANGAKFDDDKNCNYTGAEMVASFSSNGYGLYDMAGNLWEWTADWYAEDYYGSSPLSNPVGPSTGDYRVLRGGSWYYDGNNLRSALRNRFYPTYTYDYIGFRCSRSP